MNCDPQYSKSIIVKNAKILKILTLAEITHIVSNTSSCEFHTLTAVFIHNKAKPVKIIEKEFAFLGFIRTNYNVLVNLRYIDFIDPKLKMLTLKNGVKLQISIHRWRSVKAIFLQL